MPALTLLYGARRQAYGKRRGDVHRDLYREGKRVLIGYVNVGYYHKLKTRIKISYFLI